MKPSAFDYHAPTSLREALGLLSGSGSDARPLAGGQSLIPAMNLRLAAPAALVDIRRLPELAGLAVEGGVATIGACTTHAEILRAPALDRALPLLAAAGRHIGHAAIRNRGTFGGSLAHADPAAEWPTVFLALEGRARAESLRGARWIAAEDFLAGVFTTALEADEVLTRVELPVPPAGERWWFEEFALQSGAFAVAMVAIRAAVAPDGRATRIRLVVGGCGDRPVVPAIDWAPAMEGPPSPAAIETLSRRAGEALDVQGDAHMDAAGRRRIATTLVRRALERVLHRGPAEAEERR